MAEVNLYNSPVHSDSSLSAVYGESGSMWSCGFHTGIDFIPYGSTGTNPDIYPCFNGFVVEISTTGALGYMVKIQDSQGRFWRYCHMVAGSIMVTINQYVTTETKLGNMGATGNVTGIHLHLECSTTAAWNCNTFLNPATVLGIPNVRGTIIHYGGTPPPPPPPTEKGKNFKKWRLSFK